MGEIGARKRTRSFGLWFIGTAVFLISGILVIQNLNKEKGSLGESVVKSDGTETKLPHRNAGNGQSLIQAHSSSSNGHGEITAREMMISQIVGSERPVHDIAAELLKLFPESKGSEQVLVASHLGNLAEGEQLDELVSFLSDPRINKKSKEEIFNTIYDCEPKQTASLLIKVIDDGVQEFSGEAERTLSILLKADHGMDVAAWKSELDKSGDLLESDKSSQ
jgi:hypothetical protein